jgi:hypothetical protein
MPTKTPGLQPARQRLHDLMQATLADHGHWRYRAVRPQTIPASWKPGQHVDADCSDGCRMLCRWAGVQDDPAGNHYGPFGNSSSIWAHLPHLRSPGELEVGDIVLFGVNGSEHAAMVMESGSDPLLWSHGHQGAPNTYRLSYDRRVKTYCRIAVKDTPPTPQDKLRAETGFYAWVAWKLGEGPWLHYGAANPTVRPNVPKVIPPLWWKRWVAFIAARHTADAPTTS